MLNKLNQKIILLVLSFLFTNLYPAATVVESSKDKTSETKSKEKYETRSKKELETLEKLKELGLTLPDLSAIIASYSAPTRINLFFGPNLTGYINARYEKEVDDKDAVEGLLKKYPEFKKKKKSFFDQKKKEYGFKLDGKISIVKIFRDKIKSKVEMPFKKNIEMINEKVPMGNIFIAIDIPVEGFEDKVYTFVIDKSFFENKLGSYNYAISLVDDKNECSEKNEMIINSFMPNNSKTICVKRIVDK